MTDKEIIIDGVDLQEIKNLLFEGQRMSITTSTFEKIIDNLEETHKQLQREKQKNEELEDFKTLVRECFTFGDSYVDDECFVKFLKDDIEYKNTLLNGCYQLTDILGIDYTVHGGADIEEIIKNVNKYIQALKEIEEIAKICLNTDCCTLCRFETECEDTNEILSFDNNRLILNIISKMKEVTNNDF